MPMSGRTQPRREPRSVTMRLMGMSPARLLLPVLLLTASWALVACGSSPAESTNSAMSASTTPTPSNASGPAEPGRTESKNGQGRLDALSISLTLRSTRVQQGRTLRSRALIENNTSEPALLTPCAIAEARYALVPVDQPNAELWVRPVADCVGWYRVPPGYRDEFDGPAFYARTAYGDPLPPGEYLAVLDIRGFSQRLEYPVTVTR
jgi:hypothetical protein